MLKLLMAAALSAVATPSLAQLVAQPVQAPNAPRTVLPANTEIILSLNDDLTTKGGASPEGTRFNLSVVHDVRLGDYVIIPRGSRGVGEVTWITGKGAFGKSGKMDIELRYVEVGGQRIDVEGKYRQEGEGNTVATVTSVALLWPAAPFITGKSARIPRGRELAARTKADMPVVLPAGATVAASPAIVVPAATPAVAPVVATPASK